MVRRILISALLCLVTASVPARAQAPAPFDGNSAAARGDHGRAALSARHLFGANEGQKWRNELQALIDAEAPSGERKARMVAAFNRGYRGFQQSYRTCTPAADLVIRRYLEEGSKIAREVTARYAN